MVSSGLRPICCCEEGVCPHCSGGTPETVRVTFPIPECWNVFPEEPVCYGDCYGNTITIWDDVPTYQGELCLCDYIRCHDFLGTYQGQGAGATKCCWEFDQLDFCAVDNDIYPHWRDDYLAAGGTQTALDSDLEHCGFWTENGQCNSTLGRLGIKPLVCIGEIRRTTEVGGELIHWGITCDVQHTASLDLSCRQNPTFVTYWEKVMGTSFAGDPLPAGWPPPCAGSHELDYVYYRYLSELHSDFNACGISPLQQMGQYKMTIEFDPPDFVGC